MVGQRELRERLSNMAELPGFMIFEGSKGSGKSTLAKELCKERSLNFIELGNKMNDIEQLVSMAAKTTGNLFYVCDGDTMSQNAENALLKTSEELPNGNYIVLATENSLSLLPTILSRGTKFSLAMYSESDFKEYLGDKYDPSLEYCKVYPNLWHLSLMGPTQAKQLQALCKSICSGEATKSYKAAFKLSESCQEYRLSHFLYALRCELISELLTAFIENDRASKARLIKIANAIKEANALSSSNPVFSRNYILDFLFLKLHEASNL